MKLRLVKHRKLKRDALEIYAYIGENNLDAANRFLKALNADMLKLARFPRLGTERQFNATALAGLRSWPVTGFNNYLIFYRVTANEVQVWRVVHGARDLEPALLE